MAQRRHTPTVAALTCALNQPPNRPLSPSSVFCLIPDLNIPLLNLDTSLLTGHPQLQTHQWLLTAARVDPPVLSVAHQLATGSWHSSCPVPCTLLNLVRAGRHRCTFINDQSMRARDTPARKKDVQKICSCKPSLLSRGPGSPGRLC